MEKEFVSYKQALALKKLGFNEPCFRGWDIKNKIWYHPDSEVVVNNPIFSQVFTWAEENHGLYCDFIHAFYKDGVNFLWQIFWYLPVEEQVDGVLTDGTMLYGDNGDYETSRDAKIACLEKLIEILNKRK